MSTQKIFKFSMFLSVLLIAGISCAKGDDKPADGGNGSGGDGDGANPYIIYPQQGAIKYELPWLLGPDTRESYYVFAFSDYGMKTRKDDYNSYQSGTWLHEVVITNLIESKVITGIRTSKPNDQEWEEKPFSTSGWTPEELAHMGRVCIMEHTVSVGAVADLDRSFRRGTKNVAGVECAFYHCPDGSKMAIWNGIIMYEEDANGTVRLRALSVTLSTSGGSFTPTFSMPL